MNLLVSYAFGKFDARKASVRWNYGSGFPFTPTAVFYGSVPFNGDINTNYANSNANLSTIFGNLNSNRLPDYARVDLSVTKTWRFDEHRSLELDLSVTNTLDRQNIFYFDRIRYERVNQLPLLPSARISYRF
ncbi:MAG: hypothetical protein IPP83_12640 [Flavobacteriales bacterium]|nr:hypothetical protein [Flavobacteriales bacterium]